MAFVIRDRVKVTSETNGTGSFALDAAVTGYQDFSVIGDGNQTYYTIVKGSEWEVGIGTYTSSGAVLARDIVLSSSNNNQAVNFTSGTKEVFVTQAGASIQETFPTFNDSSVGSNNIGWYGFQKKLLQSSNAGSTFKSTIAVTQSLSNNSRSAGAVLSMTGDVYLVPEFSSTGTAVKISSSGVASTYSLVTNTSGGYFGGVLAANGDIHFVPNTANIGQKVSASGIVSVYSLLYTSLSGAYSGGALSPSGEVHFAPKSAPVGQKVSSTNVVSTYSLVYTTSDAYEGGVLAPNGDIHFVPSSATVGQKISAAGVVSTYSLVYTASSAYSGGIVSPNGDIHFIPRNADVGQKISMSGVVSTYSLVYTAPAGTFRGGVLAPNGDIHFVPSGSGFTGQKVSMFGVVSTYSLPASNLYVGGFVDQNGDVNFVPYNSTSHLKIYVCSGKPFNLSTRLSSFLNKY